MAVVEDIDPKDWEHREVYANFGLAIYFCQCVETSIANYVAVQRVIKLGRQLTASEHDALFEELFSRTLGHNLKQLRDLLGEGSELASELSDALKLRNDLVHHWMRDRALDQGTSAKRQAMIAELKAAQENLQAIDVTLHDRLQSMLEAGGVTRKWVQQEFERLTQIAATDP